MEPTELNPLESAAEALRAGSGSMDAFIAIFLDAPLAVPTSTDPRTGPFSPVLTNAGGVVNMAVASRPDLLSRTAEVATHAISMVGRQVVAGVQPGYGVMVSIPSGAVQLTPADLAQARGQA